jgi:hypothetical protein
LTTGSDLFFWHTPGNSEFILKPQELILHFFSLILNIVVEACLGMSIYYYSFASCFVNSHLSEEKRKRKKEIDYIDQSLPLPPSKHKFFFNHYCYYASL